MYTIIDLLLSLGHINRMVVVVVVIIIKPIISLLEYAEIWYNAAKLI